MANNRSQHSRHPYASRFSKKMQCAKCDDKSFEPIQHANSDREKLRTSHIENVKRSNVATAGLLNVDSCPLFYEEEGCGNASKKISGDKAYEIVAQRAFCSRLFSTRLICSSLL